MSADSLPTAAALSVDEREACDWLGTQAAAMCDETVALAAINSGSFHVAGVNAVRERMQAYLAPLGGEAQVIPVAPHDSLDDNGRRQTRPLGDALHIRKRPEAPLQVFLGGHLDTVFAADHAFQAVNQMDANTLHGPGVADLKGGLVVMRNALYALEQSPLAQHVGWEVLLNPDEEVGSRSSMPLIEDAARRCQVGMVFEPSFPDGHWAGQRKGSGNFAFCVTGRAAHAGREHAAGRNAIRALCDALVMLDDLNGQRPGLTINPGFVHGGGAVNVVPDRAMARFNIRMERHEDMDWCREQLKGLLQSINQREGLHIELHGAFTRPPKLLDATHADLFALAASCGRDLGLDLTHKPTGGCCDGNNLAAFGVPNIDTLGVHGGDIHSDREWMRISSLAERAKLSALLLLRLASGQWSPVVGPAR